MTIFGTRKWQSKDTPSDLTKRGNTTAKPSIGKNSTNPSAIAIAEKIKTRYVVLTRKWLEFVTDSDLEVDQYHPDLYRIKQNHSDFTVYVEEFITDNWAEAMEYAACKLPKGSMFVIQEVNEII